MGDFQISGILETSKGMLAGLPLDPSEKQNTQSGAACAGEGPFASRPTAVAEKRNFDYFAVINRRRPQSPAGSMGGAT